MKKSLLIIFLFLIKPVANGQKIGYDISFHQVFDNREYFSDYNFPQTIFGARLNAAVRFELDSMNSFAAGFNYFYEHGSDILGVPPQLNLYYAFNSQNLKMTFGSFPRSGRMEMKPLFLNDTLNYFRANIEGAYLSYLKDFVQVDFFMDWTGRISVDRREAFLAGLVSKFFMGGFYISPSLIMYHLAHTYDPADDLHILDNGAWSVIAGYQFEIPERHFKLDLSSGYASSYRRVRPEPFIWSKGILSNLDIIYNIFGIKGVYYFGDPFNFDYGDPFYRSGNYGRIDFFVDPFKNNNIESKIGWNLHFVRGEGIHHSQQVLISVRF